MRVYACIRIKYVCITTRRSGGVRALVIAISDILSWRWVFEDLSSRLTEAIEALEYELNALKVVVARIEAEISQHLREARRPRVLTQLTDAVENFIKKEYNFLQTEKRNFETLVTELDNQIKTLKRTKTRIQEDMFLKEEAVTVEESCAKINIDSDYEQKSNGKNKKRRFSSLDKWENRCNSLKRAGLQELNNAVVTRQQVRGARIRLSISAQAHSSKVDAALRRRLHFNTSKLEELRWQREEAIQDMKSLDQELLATEQNLLETMDQERLIRARIADRSLRPTRELTKDEVDRRLRDELGRLRNFMKHLRNNITDITCLQNRLTDAVTRIDCYVEDITQFIILDQHLVRQRSCEAEIESRSISVGVETTKPAPSDDNTGALTVIKEEDEDDEHCNDEYPFSY
ncbi:hypothetical protein ACJJTC_010442 [Scirpophaga incertulas]